MTDTLTHSDASAARARLRGGAFPLVYQSEDLDPSNFTFVEASETQQIGDWIASHVRAFEYLGGVTGAVVSDQLKSGVTRACRHEPEIQRATRAGATPHERRTNLNWRAGPWPSLSGHLG